VKELIFVGSALLSEEGLQAWKASFQQSNIMSDRNHTTEHSTYRFTFLLTLTFMF